MLDAFDAMAMWPLAWLPDDLSEPQSLAMLRLASATYHSGPNDIPASTPWHARLLGDVEINQSAVDALGLGGRTGLTVAEIEVSDTDGWASDLARFGTADGRAATIRTVDVLDPQASDFGASLSTAATTFVGVVRQVDRVAGMRARIAFDDVTAQLTAPLQSARFQGTGGLEGGAELTGLPRPIAFGQCFNVRPVYLGNIDLGAGALPTYQTNWRAIVAHDAVTIRGVTQNPTTGTPVVGQYHDWPTLGIFQLGASPDGEVRASLRGDTGDGYVNTTATVLRVLLQRLGPQFADTFFDSAAWSQADYDLGGPVCWVRGTEEITTQQAVDEILAGCGAVLAGGRSGKLRLFDPLSHSDEQFNLPPEWILDCQPVGLPAQLRPTPRAVSVQHTRNWAPLSDLAGSVPQEERQRLTSTEAPAAVAESSAITSRVAQQRVLTLPGLYSQMAAARQRAERFREWLERGPRIVTVTTDRYLGQVELGHIGTIQYPAYGLDNGMTGVVLGWRESLGARRLELTILETRPTDLTVTPTPTAAVLGTFVLGTDSLG